MRVTSFIQLKAALSSADTDIVLGKDIPILEPITIPREKYIYFQNYMFLSRGNKILFYGGLEPIRKQRFYGFKPGDIAGTFNSDKIFPEWWGLIPNQNEIAINCAISSLLGSVAGHTISLASGTYFVSGPIDLRASLSYLVGASSGSTFIVATKDWNAKFEDSTYWSNHTKIDPESHAAMIWIGSVVPANQSFRTGVRSLTVSAYEASKKHRDKRISCISSTGYVEENSIVEDVCLNGFSGFGIGFNNGFGVSTVNGLSLRNFWITAAMHRDAVGIYIPHHAGVASIRDGTIDCRVGKASIPEKDWPSYGMVVSGAHTCIDNVHIEGCGAGIYIQSTDTPASVSVSNVSVNYLMNHGMSYYDEPIPNTPAPPIEKQKADFPGQSDPFYYKYSCAVLIGRLSNLYASSKAYNVSAVISNVRSLGRCCYLLRDNLYGVNFSSFGIGQYPNSGNSVLTFYARPEGFIPNTGAYPYGDGTINARNSSYTQSGRVSVIGPI